LLPFGPGVKKNLVTPNVYRAENTLVYKNQSINVVHENNNCLF